MAGTGRVTASAKAVGHNQYDVSVNFQIAFDWGGWNQEGAYYTIYCNGQQQSGTATFSINSGGGSWVWGNIATKTFRVTMPTSGKAHTINFSAGITTGVTPNYIDAYGSTTLAARTWQWPVTYNANGGTGAPGAQTKDYGKNLNLSNTKPTREGHDFEGWATTSTGAVAYQPGAVYSSNAALNLYAKWKIHTYTITYDANGGTGAPASQTKTYGQNLTISNTKPVRTNYNFKGWGTSAASTTIAYASGATYTGNTALTLYAIWELAYLAPRITKLSVDRCDSAGTLKEDGMYVKISFNWATDKNAMRVIVGTTTPQGASHEGFVEVLTGTSGTVTKIFGNNRFNTDTEYSGTIRLIDEVGHSDRYYSIPPLAYIMDILHSGDGIAFGGSSSRPGIDVFMNTYFNKPTRFDAYMDIRRNIEIQKGAKLIVHPNDIIANTDLNTIVTPGIYGCHDGDAGTLKNCPTWRGFRLEVSYAYNQEGYINQELYAGKSSDRYGRRYKVSDNTWTQWEKYVLESDLGEFIRVKLTTAKTLNNAMVPFDTVDLKHGSRFTLGADGKITVGAGVSMVRINAKIGCKSGNSGRSWIYLYINNVYSNYDLQYGLYPILNLTHIAKVKEGDTISIKVIETVGVSMDGLYSFLTVEKII